MKLNVVDSFFIGSFDNFLSITITTTVSISLKFNVPIFTDRKKNPRFLLFCSLRIFEV